MTVPRFRTLAAEHGVRPSVFVKLFFWNGDLADDRGNGPIRKHTVGVV
jgi:hypothetical protein